MHGNANLWGMSGVNKIRDHRHFLELGCLKLESTNKDEGREGIKNRWYLTSYPKKIDILLKALKNIWLSMRSLNHTKIVISSLIKNKIKTMMVGLMRK